MDKIETFIYKLYNNRYTMVIDYADFESGFTDEIEKEFLKKMNIVSYEELTEQKIEKLRELFPDQYDAALDKVAQEQGAVD
jgi:hypothetical protein